MRQLYSWSWVAAQVAQTIEVWNSSSAPSALGGPQYSLNEQQTREKAYDRELRAVEREAKRAPRTRAERLAAQDRIVASFARFSAAALDLQDDAVNLLTNDFLPAGTRLARWARRFDPSLSMADIIQACRNAWTACGLQPLLGERVGITPSILGYSLLYPYSDNYLDRADVSAEAKLRFSERFRDRLRGDRLSAQDDREAALWNLVLLIEEQYPRVLYPQIFDSLLAIHRAQEGSIAQINNCDPCSDDEVLRMSCAKGGSSVLADACLARGWLNEEESRFSFEWGVLLQLGDDLQDVREDMQRGSVTLFSRAAAQGIRSVMHLMYECATRWELFTDKRNPIALVRIKGGSKRRQRPIILSVEQFELVVATLREPYRTMVQIAQCLGLRVSEIAALQWDDFDFEKNQLLVQRSFVSGRVDDVKTEYSQDYVPLHPSLTKIVLDWSKQAVPTAEGWVFANPITNRPYHPTEIQKRHLRPSGCCVVACPTCGAAAGVWCWQDGPTANGKRVLVHDPRKVAAGKLGEIGWHTFRHTYRSWLDETGAPMKVQQELMRHASIQTTMNIYGQAMSSSKREANGKVVEMVLKPVLASA